MYWVGCAKEHTHQPPWGMEMCQGAGWDMESHEQLALGSCCPSTSRGRGSHTQGSKLWSAQRAMVVGCTQPTTRQADTHNGDIRPGGLGSQSEETDLSQTGRVAGRWGPGERQQATHGSTGRHLGILGILQDGLGIQRYA